MTTQQHLWSMTAIVSTLLVGNMAVQMVNAQGETPVPKVLVAQEFRMVNARNQTLATMAIGLDGGPQIALYDGFGPHDENGGTKRLQLNVNGSDDGYYYPSLQLNGNSGARLKVSLVNFKGDGSAPRIEIMDKDNQARGILGMNANNNPDLILRGDTGAYAGLKPESLSISAGSGKEFGTTWLAGGQGPGLIFADENGKWIWTAPPKKATPKKK